MDATIALKKSEGTYTPDYVQKVLRFTSNPNNKRRYRERASVTALLRIIEARARARSGTYIFTHELKGYNGIIPPWSRIIERSIDRKILPLGFRIGVRESIGTQGEVSRCTTVEWGHSQ